MARPTTTPTATPKTRHQLNPEGIQKTPATPSALATSPFAEKKAGTNDEVLQHQAQIGA